MSTNRLVVKEQVQAYAEMLFNAANEAGGRDAVLEVRDQAKQIVAALRENHDLEDALKNTSFTGEQRGQIARAVTAQCHPAFSAVFGVMAERNEVDYLYRVVNGLEKQLADKLNTVVLEVTTVVELDDHLRDIITKKAESELNKKIVLNEHIDKSILGGIIMSTGDERIDASVISQLEHTRELLKQA